MICRKSAPMGAFDGLAFEFGADADHRAVEMAQTMMAAPWRAMWTVAMEAWNPANYFPR